MYSGSIKLLIFTPALLSGMIVDVLSFPYWEYRQTEPFIITTELATQYRFKMFKNGPKPAHKIFSKPCRNLDTGATYRILHRKTRLGPQKPLCKNLDTKKIFDEDFQKN